MFTYGQTLYASWSPLVAASQDDIVINGFWLQNEYICTSYNFEWNIMDFTHFKYPKNNWRGLLWYFNRWKKINFKIHLRWDNVSDFQSRLDNLRKYLFQPEVNLDIKIDWKVRRIKANCISAPKKINHYNITFLPIDIQLETLEPFFYELSNQTSSFLWKTSSFDEYIYNNWTAVSDPRIYFAFKTWISWTDNISINIWDRTIIINQSISDNDVLVVDCEKKTVKLNDVKVDYDGLFPELNIDWNAISFTINWTFDVDINVLNKVNYV